MKTDEFERLAAEASKLTDTLENPLSIPYHVALQEAANAASFVDQHWEPNSAAGIPGLSAVAARLPRATAEEIRSHIQAVQVAQTRLLLLIDPGVVDHGERAREVIDELESALEFLLDDGVHEPADDQLAQLKEFHSQDGQRSTALAQSLRDYGNLAHALSDRLVANDTSFDPALTKEAIKLADTLATAPAPSNAKSPEARDATVLRNRLLHQLVRRVAAVRKASAYVFRKHPDVHKKVTSSYERRRRAEARAKAAKTDKTA